jgi:hypothetical protein
MSNDWVPEVAEPAVTSNRAFRSPHKPVEEVLKNVDQHRKLVATDDDHQWVLGLFRAARVDRGVRKDLVSARPDLWSPTTPPSIDTSQNGKLRTHTGT